MNDTAVLDVIDRIYAASLDRFEWPDALGRACDLVGAGTGLLLTPARDEHGWRIAAASRLADEFVHAYNSQWCRVDPFLAPPSRLPGSTVTIRQIEASAAASTPFGQFFCEPAGLRTGLFAASRENGGSVLLFWRAAPEAFTPADVERLRTLWPHVSRALNIQAASSPNGAGMVPAVWSESLLDLWHVAVVGFSRAGRHVYTNHAARGLAAKNDGLTFAVDGPVASSTGQTRQLRDLIRQLANGTRRGPEWLRLARPSGAAAYEVALVASPDGRQDGPAVAMFAAAPDEPVVCCRDALQRLHGLTVLEADVAECVVKSMPIPELAQTLDLSLQTARWYVQQVREKLDAASQGHVIRTLLRGLAAVEWPAIPEDSDRRPN